MTDLTNSLLQRRGFLGRLAAAAGAGFALVGCGTSAPAGNAGAAPAAAGKKFRWRLVMVVPKTFKIWGDGILEFADKVRVMSGGRLNIDVYGAGELVPPLEVFDAVKQGQVELGHSASYYWRGKIPGAEYFTSVPFGLNADGMLSWLYSGEGLALWEELYAPHGIKPIPCGNTGVQMGGWFRKEIKSIEDFRGLKMRMPGVGGEVIAKAGAKPVLIPGNEIFPHLETGVIDAAEWIGPYHDYLLGLPKVANYYYSAGWHEPGSMLELLVNLEAWNSLPEDLQLIVRNCAIATSSKMFASWLHMDAVYYEKLKQEGKTIFKEFPPEVTHQLHLYADEVLKEVAGKSPIAAKIHASFKAFQQSYEAYQELSERAYVRAQKA